MAGETFGEAQDVLQAAPSSGVWSGGGASRQVTPVASGETISFSAGTPPPPCGGDVSRELTEACASVKQSLSSGAAHSPTEIAGASLNGGVNPAASQNRNSASGAMVSQAQHASSLPAFSHLTGDGAAVGAGVPGATPAGSHTVSQLPFA
ncbi:hypothetical protein TraAM80_09594 [Trypanosoma rangeli]|uniref:Uncharacterized protein n=1 Tax=Trypanosoma rangeli TaxID=5698 RepID=A0A3R7R6M7_TRYRA|nr:uncharacterized protein TraAM80_09594 [Trypanosoma rangeli]RNE96868.1 hypothetical protein TraAM80_09594 [Trypanosoma rangeli]|eukprot:RNE96868.1 hypothetical protein TraAM80_09594 [Trypanosoma rangeli]